MRFIPRAIEQTLLTAARAFPATVVTGPRRAGKTTLLRRLFPRARYGELNMVEAVLDRNTAIGARQYSIPPDASPANIAWDRFPGNAPKRPFEPIRLFRWRNDRDYGTGVRTRKPFFEDGVFGFRAAGPSLLTNTSLYESRVCNWDAERMTTS